MSITGANCVVCRYTICVCIIALLNTSVHQQPRGDISLLLMVLVFYIVRIVLTLYF